MRFVDLSGQKFCRLTAVRVDAKPQGSKNRHTYWLCECECGNLSIVSSDKLIGGETKSCGCLKAEVSAEKIKKFGKPHKTHGHSYDRLYNIYHHMKGRCYNNKNRKYKDYGARGILVCEEWLTSFDAFYKWAMGNGYSDNLTIDRIDNDGDYSPENCRWVTNEVQQNNKRTSRIIEINGEKFTLAQLRDKAGIPLSVLWWRVKHGWTGERILTPVRRKGAKK